MGAAKHGDPPPCLPPPRKCAGCAAARRAALEALAALDAIGCAPMAPCDGPAERAMSALLRISGPIGDDGAAAALARLGAAT